MICPQWLPILWLSLMLSGVYLLEPLTIGAIGATLTALYYKADKIKELADVEENCYDGRGWINREPDFSELDSKVFGQNLASKVVKKLVSEHLKKENPEKALILSFHGYTGIGKTFMAKLIAKAIFTSYAQHNHSKYVHFIVSSHFLAKPTMGRFDLNDMIEESIQQCDRSLFIIDEVDKYPPQFLDVIGPLSERGNHLGTNYNRAIYILIGNSGGAVINKRTLELRTSGTARDDIVYSDFQPILDISAFEEGGLRDSDLISRAMINMFVPFMPLEREHVRQCTVAYLKHDLQWSEDKIRSSSHLIDRVVDDMSYVSDAGLYSRHGCKRVASRVDMLV